MTDHLQLVVRDIVQRLRPPGLDELGLSAALENCVDGWRRRLPSVNIEMAVSDDLGPLDEATNITLYRLVQEGLTNVARHAHASRVEVQLQQQSVGAAGLPEVVLTMRDNGRGREAAPPNTGVGLVGMRERVEALAGRFDITSVPGSGFGFTAWLPIHQGDSA
jgi:signal transduction histidine kinase